jgi:signal peptidase II
MIHIRASILLVIVLCLDLLTKYFFYDRGWGQDISWIAAHFNPGIAWSLPVPIWLTLMVALCAIAVLVYRYITKQMQRYIIAVLIAGILGNAYDRVVWSGVRDFIDLGWFPVFNIADVAITLGAIAIILAHFSPWKFGMKE